jgi:plasmid stabilization system protein ParE
MVNKIEFSRHSLAELGEILTYLQENASEQVAIRFADLVKNNFSNLDLTALKGAHYLHSKRFALFALGNIIECIIAKMV